MFDNLRRRTSEEQVKKKIDANPALHDVVQQSGSFDRYKGQYQSAAQSWGREIAKMMVLYQWGGADAAEPILRLESPRSDTTPFEDIAEIYDRARLQADKFNLYVQATAAQGASEKPELPPEAPPEHIRIAYEQYVAALADDQTLENAKQSKIYAAIKRRASVGGQELPDRATFFRYVRKAREFYEPGPSGADQSA